MQWLCSDVYMLSEHLLTASVIKGLNEQGEIRKTSTKTVKDCHMFGSEL